MAADLIDVPSDLAKSLSEAQKSTSMFRNSQMSVYRVPLNTGNIKESRTCEYSQ